jgi:hypothetical protein
LKSKSDSTHEIELIDEAVNSNMIGTTTDLFDDATTQSTTATTDTHRQHGTNKSTYSKQDKTQVNDGTLRMTIRWKPSDYTELRQDDKAWSETASKMLRDIFYHPTNTIYVVPWQDKSISAARMVPTHSINQENLKQVCSPQISHIDSYSMSIIGIRICVSDTTFTTGSWINNEKVKTSLATNNVEVQISNSTCDSGTMMTAGAILLKHPGLTHRMYFLLALRRKLPNNTPFFDIGVHKRTQNGIECHHLVVRCGENHHEVLTEILSDCLDGKQTTALYIGTKILASMTQEATEDLFDTHQKYVNSLQRLPLSPQIVNIDRTREERLPTGKIMQSTRDWANSVKTDEGKPLQCDAENGGKDRKAYLLVPAPLIATVQPILQQYLASIRNNAQSQTNTGAPYDRPDEIYVPTASVQRNVDFLRNMSSVDIWKNAPSTIRHSQRYQESIPPTMTAMDRKAAAAPMDQAHMRTPIRHGQSSQSINDNTGSNSQSNQATTTQPAIRPIDDNTIATYTSTASTTLNSSYHANRFAELEAAIKANQKDFKSMNKQYQTMENKIIETMTSCHENTKQLITMQGQMNTLQTTIQSIADQMQFITQHLKDANESANSPTEPTLNSPVKKKQRHHEESEIPRQLTYHAMEPLNTQDDNHASGSTPADQEEAQYTETSFPDMAMEE